MTTSPILVTGATGNLGTSVVASLRRRGASFRAADLDPARVRDRFGDVDAVRLDFSDPTSFAAALDGVRGVFLVRPPAIARVGPTINRFIDAASGAEAGHVVFSSVAGAENNKVVPHHRIEQHLFASGLSWTVLRPGFFAQNLGGPYRIDIRDGRRIHVPAGDGKVAFVDVRDLGEVAAAILTEPDDHAGQAYTITGPTAVTFTEVADLLTAELGNAVRYEPATVLGYLRHLRHQGLPFVQQLVQTVLHTGLRRGDAEQVDHTLPRLLGHPARTMQDYIHDHRELWLEQTHAI